MERTPISESIPAVNKVCPPQRGGCGQTFDMFGDGQMVIGTDEHGLYLEHVPCGFRGRPGMNR